MDNGKRAEDAVEFYSLGLGDYYTVASINGSGTGELLDAFSRSFTRKEEVRRRTS